MAAGRGVGWPVAAGRAEPGAGAGFAAGRGAMGAGLRGAATVFGAFPSGVDIGLNSVETFGKSFATVTLSFVPIPKRSRQLRLSEPPVEFWSIVTFSVVTSPRRVQRLGSQDHLPDNSESPSGKRAALRLRYPDLAK